MAVKLEAVPPVTTTPAVASKAAAPPVASMSSVTPAKVRAPTLSNVYAVPDMLKGDTLADVPLVIAAIDPCMSCADRVTVVHEEDNSTEVLTKADLHKITVKKYGQVRK